MVLWNIFWCCYLARKCQLNIKNPCFQTSPEIIITTNLSFMQLYISIMYLTDSNRRKSVIICINGWGRVLRIIFHVLHWIYCFCNTPPIVSWDIYFQDPDFDFTLVISYEEFLHFLLSTSVFNWRNSAFLSTSLFWDADGWQMVLSKLIFVSLGFLLAWGPFKDFHHIVVLFCSNEICKPLKYKSGC